jgi:hypothetical protein
MQSLCKYMSHAERRVGGGNFLLYLQTAIPTYSSCPLKSPDGRIYSLRARVYEKKKILL